MQTFWPRLLARWADTDLRNFEILQVHGPIVYRQEWGKEITEHNASLRPTLTACDLWCVEFKCDDFSFPAGLTVLVLDGHHYLLPADARYNSRPRYEPSGAYTHMTLPTVSPR